MYIIIFLLLLYYYITHHHHHHSVWGGVKMRKIERYQKDAQDAHFTGICEHIIFISQVEIRENKPRTLLTGE